MLVNLICQLFIKSNKEKVTAFRRGLIKERLNFLVYCDRTERSLSKEEHALLQDVKYQIGWHR